MIRQIPHFIIMYVLAPLLAFALIALGLFASGSGVNVAVASSANGPLFMFVFAQAIRRHRRQVDVAALSHLEQAVRLNLPLVAMLKAAGASETGRLRARLIGMSQDLEQAVPIAQTMARQLRSLSHRSISLVDAAEQTGCLAPQLSRLAADERRHCRHEAGREPLAVIYPLIVLATLTCTIGFTGVYIVPKFAKIFEDFDIPLPAVTLSLMSVGDVVGAIAMFIGGVIIAFTFISALWQIANPPIYRNALTNLILRAAWRIPLIHGIEQNRGLADLFDTLADSIEAGHPLPMALESARQLAINPVLHDRVARCLGLVEAGSSIDQAAHQSRFPKIAVGMLRSGQAAGNLPDVCRFLARHFRSRFSRVAALIRGGIVPAIVMVLACLVGVVVYSLFVPLVLLIESVAASTL